MIKEESKIALIYTGGTIGMVKSEKTGALRAFNFDLLLKKIPELQLLEHQIETYTFDTPIDSSNIGIDDYVRIAAQIEEIYDEYDAFVVLHGSDTMSYTASVLSFMFENLSKPIILTGSQLPIGDLRTDAKENLITSIQLAGFKKDGKPVIREVGLYFEYKLYRGNRTTKLNTDHFQAFSSINYPFLAESAVNLEVNFSALKKINLKQDLIVHKQLNPNILVIKMFPALQKETFEHLLATPNLEAVVLETFGSGNSKTDLWFLNALEKSIEKGIQVVNVTQCKGGSVVMGKYETSQALKEMGVINGKDITTESALGKLMYLLPKKLQSKVLKTVFETSLRGEMSSN
ncbi:MAG: asparaginase [Flavobacteriaceae bacterium]|nr:asparaginase [Flavobacteriaceae bacterium]